MWTNLSHDPSPCTYISYLGFMLHWPLPAGSFIERLTKQWTVGNVDNSCVWSNWIAALCFLTQVLLKLTANKAWCLDNVKLIIRLLLWMAFTFYNFLCIAHLLCQSEQVQYFFLSNLVDLCILSLMSIIFPFSKVKEGFLQH